MKMKLIPNKYIDEVIIYCDGGCKPNPGIMVGAFLVIANKTVLRNPNSFHLGNGTSVVAELKTIEKALEEATEHTRKQIKVFCDNEFVVKALNKEYRIKKSHLKPIISAIYQKAALFESVTFYHVNENNKFVKACDNANKQMFGQLDL